MYRFVDLFLDRPTTRLYLESKKSCATNPNVRKTVCHRLHLAKPPTTEPLVPPPRLEFAFLKGSNGNVETVLCSRALSNEWVSKYVREDQGDHPDLNIFKHNSVVCWI